MKLAAILVLALVGIAVAQSVTPIPREVRLVGEIPASWWTYVRVTAMPDGTPEQTYAVPQDRYLVVTDLNRSGGLHVDALGFPPLAVLERGGAVFSGNGTRVVIPPGSLIEACCTSSATTELWGYLEPVR